MPQTEAPLKQSRFILLATVVLIVTCLHLAQEVLIPVALAILLSFLLAPLVHRLERLKLPRVVAVVAAVMLALSVVAGIGYVVYAQMGFLASHKAEYESVLERKVQSFESSRLLTFLHTTGAEVTQVKEALQRAQPKAATTQPTPVEVVNQPNSGESSSPMDWIATIGSKLLGPVGTAFIVTVFTIFMLMQREDLRDRVIRLAGRDRMTLTTEALDDAASRVSRYLLLQTVVNSCVGLTIGVLLWLVGIILHHPFPSPALWGLLAALLRFVPYIGIWISAIGPVVLSIAVFPAARGTILTAGVYCLTEGVTANAIEPLLFGSSTGIATLAVLVAAIFWTWLWGPVGLLLSTPLTVCLVVMGKYIPQLEFLNVLLADEPALSPPDRVYQRLLAEDVSEAAQLVLQYEKKMPAVDLFQTVLLPALATAEADHYRTGIDDERHEKILDGFAKILDDVSLRLRSARKIQAAEDVVHTARGEPVGASRKTADAPESQEGAVPADCGFNIICVPAHADADALAARMIGLLLELRGYCVTVASVDRLASEIVSGAEAGRGDLIVVSALPPTAVTHARYLVKRLHEHHPDLPVVVGLWTAEEDLSRATERIAGAASVRATAGFPDALRQVHELAQPKLMADAGYGDDI
jgi:predicted PurR-regulated permease PerM/methylmalonyl-CoA mutase cobalamin-binding subunit